MAVSPSATVSGWIKTTWFDFFSIRASSRFNGLEALSTLTVRKLYTGRWALAPGLVAGKFTAPKISGAHMRE
jgi:hypothetical protein